MSRQGATVGCDVGKLCFQSVGHADAEVASHGGNRNLLEFYDTLHDIIYYIDL